MGKSGDNNDQKEYSEEKKQEEQDEVQGIDLNKQHSKPKKVDYSEMMTRSLGHIEYMDEFINPIADWSCCVIVFRSR